jgi:hypothetical protein
MRSIASTKYRTLQNSKFEARSTKWFDQLTTLSQVEGQVRMSNAPMFKTKSINL